MKAKYGVIGKVGAKSNSESKESRALTVWEMRAFLGNQEEVNGGEDI